MPRHNEQIIKFQNAEWFNFKNKRIDIHSKKEKTMKTLKTTWVKAVTGVVALVLGVLFISHAFEKELPKKEGSETAKKLEMITFVYEAPDEEFPYDDVHILNSENWKAVETNNCSQVLNPNAPCSIEVEETYTVGGNEIDFSLVTLKLTSISTKRHIVAPLILQITIQIQLTHKNPKVLQPRVLFGVIPLFYKSLQILGQWHHHPRIIGFQPILLIPNIPYNSYIPPFFIQALNIHQSHPSKY